MQTIRAISYFACTYETSALISVLYINPRERESGLHPGDAHSFTKQARMSVVVRYGCSTIAKSLGNPLHEHIKNRENLNRDLEIALSAKSTDRETACVRPGKSQSYSINSE